jgi:hypothetical protein
MTEITDEYMRERLSKVRGYTLVLLKATPELEPETHRPLIWEHGRRNMSLVADGPLSIVCPVAGDTDLCGIGIFDASEAEVTEIMDGDPAVRAGIFSYEVHPVRGFPGQALPG